MANDLSGRNSGSIGLQQSYDVSRRQLFRGAAVIVGGVAVFAATMTAQPAKAGMTKQASGYQGTPKGAQRCDNCAQFKAPSSCNLVAGDISPAGWCRLWVKKS